ncbi:MAG: hypothetical protein KIT84_09950 [Labilithrix sp.]|nr:hypothetical protein [Labilithrix sp.]MCW5811325.1 hypothetical protein [Labilithrix sp.]
MERFRFLLSLGIVASVGVLAVIACDPPQAKKGPLKTTPAPDDDDDDTVRPDDDDDITVTPKPPESDPELPDGGKPPGRVYAHSASALFLFNPLNKKLEKIADFQGLHQTTIGTTDRVLDIALDRDSAMYGTTDNGFVKIDPIDAKVTYIKEEGNFLYPNGLGFVPMGTVDPTKEALVGYKVAPDAGVGEQFATDYYRIDLQTGNMTRIGQLNPPGAAMKYKSSGDIISMLRNDKAYVAVRPFDPSTDAGVPDSIAEIDPKTGQIKTVLDDTGFAEFWGLGQWAGAAYGFSNRGAIVEIDLVTGKGKLVTTEPSDAGVAQWFGAGVTTNAPTKP